MPQQQPESYQGRDNDDCMSEWWFNAMCDYDDNDDEMSVSLVEETTWS